MLREASVCIFTGPHSIGAAASVDSGTTDDTGIGSSCPLPSPSLPIGHSDHESPGDNPPPIPPKVCRRIPPLPPRNGSHGVSNINTCPDPRYTSRLPIDFNPPSGNVFSGNLLVNSPCPCGRSEPWGSEGKRNLHRVSGSIQKESGRPIIFHPHYETKLTDATKSGCGSLQRICASLTRLLRSASLRERSQTNSPTITSTPTIPPRHLVRNLDRNTVRGFLSAHAATSIQQSCSIRTPSSVDTLRRHPNQATNPSAYTIGNDHPFTATQVQPPRRQRPGSRSSLIAAATLRNRKQQQQQQQQRIADSSSSSTTPSMYTISPSRVPPASAVFRDPGANNNSFAAVGPLRQAASTSPTCPTTSTHRRSSQATSGLDNDALVATVPDGTVARQTSAPPPPPPVLLHHVHIHHVHHYHHGPDSGAVGLALPTTANANNLTDGRISTTSSSSGGGGGGVGDHQLLPTSSWCCSSSSPSQLCSGAVLSTASTLPAVGTRAGACCCCCSPDLGAVASGTAAAADGSAVVVQDNKPAGASDLFAQTPTPADHCQSRARSELTPGLPSRCCSSASATLTLGSRGSPGSCCYSCSCCCCCCPGNCCYCSTSAQRHTLQHPPPPPPPHRHHTHTHHHTQHHHHPQQHPHRHSSVGSQPRASTRGNGGSSAATVCCCCGGGGGGGGCSASMAAAVTPPFQPGLLNSGTARAAIASGAAHRGSRCSPSVAGQSGCLPLSPVLSSVPTDDSLATSATTTSTSATAIVASPANTTLTAELQDRRSSFQRSMLELRKMGWYWGPISFIDAQLLLAKRPDGTFLVRDSGHDTYILSLSFRVRGETYHTRIDHSQGRFSFWSQPQTHSASTMVEFIEKAVAHSISGQFHYFLQSSAPGQPPIEVPLLYPLSRFQVVPSLRHLSRFTILSHIRRDHIDRLPLPRGLLQYLSEKQCYAESLEAYEAAMRDRSPLPFQPRQASAVLSQTGADDLVGGAETPALSRSLRSPQQQQPQGEDE